jgi:nucleoside-diphosphate-sugar epimerase
MSDSSSRTVTIFGATGPVGIHLINYLLKHQPNWQIHAVTRSQVDSATAPKNKDNHPMPTSPSVKWIQGDVLNADSVKKCVESSDLVFSCVGLDQYSLSHWAANWPRVVDNLLCACKYDKETPQRRLVFCDNLYAYGFEHDAIKTCSSTVPPSTDSKPAIRSLMRRAFEQHMRDYPGTLTVIGSTDFFGPLIGEASMISDDFCHKIQSGGRPMVLGSSKVIHDFAFVPDVARTLAMASLQEAAYDKFWIVPCAVHNKTIQEIANDMAEIAHGKPTKVKLTEMGSWSCKLLSWVVPVLGDMVEMLPMWKRDYKVDDSETIDKLNIQATPYKEALKMTMDAAKASK